MRIKRGNARKVISTVLGTCSVNTTSPNLSENLRHLLTQQAQTEYIPALPGLGGCGSHSLCTYEAQRLARQ
jgi:hypothetical protein